MYLPENVVVNGYIKHCLSPINIGAVHLVVAS